MAYRPNLRFRDRVSRAFQQARANRFDWQLAAYWLSGAWTKLQGALLAVIGLYGLNEASAAEIFSTFERFLPWFIAAFVIPYIILAIAFVSAFLSRLSETYAEEPERIAGGIEIHEGVQHFAMGRGFDRFAIGGAIEVLSYPFLDKRISNNGWHPGAVEIKPSRRQFDIPEQLRNDVKVHGDDNQKYSLVGASRPTTDDFGRLRLEVAPTKYSLIESARQLTDNDKVLRHEFSNLSPEQHRLPNSLCLHALVLLADQNVLAMKRRDQTSYFPGAISVSLEEQLAKIDFETPGIEASESLFRRAICEEVFPLANRYEIDPKDSWGRISSCVDHYRYWSLLFEENIGNFALFGVCKLRLSLAEYLSEFSRIQSEYKGIRDDEGKMYYLSLSNLRDYLQSGHGVISVANYHDQNRRETEAIRSVHPTTPYRGATLLSCFPTGI